MQDFERQHLTDQDTGSSSTPGYDDDSLCVDGRAAKLAALEHLPDAVIVLDRDWRILYANQVLPGMREGGILGKSIFECAPDSWHQQMNDALVRALSNRAADRFEVEVSTSDGPPTFLEFRVGVAAHNGQGAALVLSVSDIGGRRAAETATRIDAERYRFLTETISDVIWTMDLDQRVTYVSASIRPVVGYAVKEVQSMALSELLVPESFALARETLLDELRPEKTAMMLEAGAEIQMDLFRQPSSQVISHLATLNLDNVTPLEALRLLTELKDELNID
jgi:PAS domain S-box-containing protein